MRRVEREKGVKFMNENIKFMTRTREFFFNDHLIKKTVIKLN